MIKMLSNKNNHRFDQRYFPLIAGAMLVLGTGVVHGILTDRWGTSDALREAATRVRDVPLDIGDWRGTELEVNREAFERAGAVAYWKRRYEDKKGKTAVIVVLMCGRPGRMGVHNPALYFGDGGLQEAQDPTNYALTYGSDGKHADLRTARYANPEREAESIRLFWAWKDPDGGWEAPANARWDFRGAPSLYKLCVFHPIKAGQSIDQDPALDFLRSFLTEAAPGLRAKK